MRLLVFSQTRLFAECLAEGLASLDSIAATSVADTIDAAAAALANQRIDAVLIDLSNPDGWQQARLLRSMCSSSCFLGLAVHDSAHDVVESARLGCDAIIPHHTSLSDTAQIVRRALRGEAMCTPAAIAGLMRAVAQTPEPAQPDGMEDLTPREREICAMVSEGMTNKQIARRANCSEGTVKNHVHSILSKLHLPRRSAIGVRMVHWSGQPPASEASGLKG